MPQFNMRLNLNDEQLAFWADWIDTLESGQLKQAESCLKTRDKANQPYGYCCLGVACDIHPGASWVPDKLVGPVAASYNTTTHDTELPFDLRVEIGLPDELESILAMMNDAGASFRVIAMFLREVAGFASQFRGIGAVDELSRNFGTTERRHLTR